jgi:hypothetical protein
VRSHLEPDGVFVQWISLTYVDEALLRSLAATLVDVFGHVEVYQPDAGKGVLFAASARPLASLDGARRALRAVPEDLARLGFHRVEDIAPARVLDEAGTRTLAEGGELNTDDHNRLASRASRLGEAALDPDSVRALWQGPDPLLAEMHALDRAALIRRLVARGFKERATQLALSQDGAAEEASLGWIELGLGRNRRASRHFTRALELAPGSEEAVAGLVVSGFFGSERGRAVAGVAEADLDERLAAVIAARRHGAAEDWTAVAALDAELGRLAPGEALFEAASRLRVRWRLAAAEPEAAAEAQALAETLLVRQWSPADELLRARAAIAAGRPTAAWGSLSRIADLRQANPQVRALVESALELTASLPEETARDLRTRLRAPRPPAAGR